MPEHAGVERQRLDSCLGSSRLGYRPLLDNRFGLSIARVDADFTGRKDVPLAA